MPQFHLYKNANKATQRIYPFLLDIHNGLLDELRTTVVIPWMPKRLAGSHTMSKLNPVVRIKNEAFVVMTRNLAGIDRAVMGELVGDFGQHRPALIAAIDFVLSGI